MFAGDAYMPLPYIVDGDIDELAATINQSVKWGLKISSRVMGTLYSRGEIEDHVKENLNYLSCLRKGVRNALKRKNPEEALVSIDIESCGKIGYSWVVWPLNCIKEMFFIYSKIKSEEMQQIGLAFITAELIRLSFFSFSPKSHLSFCAVAKTLKIGS